MKNKYLWIVGILVIGAVVFYYFNNFGVSNKYTISADGNITEILTNSPVYCSNPEDCEIIGVSNLYCNFMGGPINEGEAYVCDKFNPDFNVDNKCGGCKYYLYGSLSKQFESTCIASNGQWNNNICLCPEGIIFSGYNFGGCGKFVF